MSTPAEQLKGQQLENGWVVGDLIPKTAAQTGGHFSCSYGVTNADGRSAFLKAMDYTAALSAPDPATALNELTRRRHRKHHARCLFEDVVERARRGCNPGRRGRIC